MVEQVLLLGQEYKARMEKNHDVIVVASYGTFSTGISIKNIHKHIFYRVFQVRSYNKAIYR